MAKFVRQRELIDRKTLTEQLDSLVEVTGYSQKIQKDVLKLFKAALKEGNEEVQRRFENREANGILTVHAQAFLMDQLIRSLHDFTVTHVFPMHAPTQGEKFAIVAVGGYGRAEMAPQSDIDLLFLLPYKQTPKVEQAVEYMLYLLWDLGLKVGHSTRSIDDCIRLAKDDLTIQTALLDARYLWGNKGLFEAFQLRFETDIINGNGRQFVEAKLAERDERHMRFGDTRYVLEPNIKEGKGCLRDLQTLFWISKFLYKVERMRHLVELEVMTKTDARRFKKAVNFLWTVRCQLHYLTKRPEERLTFDVQNTMAQLLGYEDHAGSSAVERFMKHFFLIAKDVGDLTRNLCVVLEDQQKKQQSLFRLPNLFKRNVEGFTVDAGRLTISNKDAFKDDPVLMIRLFQIAQEHDLDIHPDALAQIRANLRLLNRKLRHDPEANRIFLEMLTSRHEPQKALRLMSEAGVLGRFVPDFGRVVAQMQYDMYHVYTVDEHTIRAIGELYKVDSGHHIEALPVTCEAMTQVISRRALYVAVMLHDIAKGRGGDHSEIGAEVAMTLGPRFGLSEEETETVAWLVRHHLSMSRLAFKRDLEDPKLVADFVQCVQSPERLRLLLVLTVVDIRAVGPNVWNGWKANLLRTLYFKAMEHMSGGESAQNAQRRVEIAKDRLRDKLADWNKDDVENFVSLGYPSYWLGFDVDAHARHAALVKQQGESHDVVILDSQEDNFNKINEITIYTADHPGLFSIIAGAMALSGATIVDAKIATLNNGMALDAFSVQDANEEPFTGKDRLERLRQRIAKALAGEIYPAAEIEKAKKSTMASRTSVFQVPPRVLIDNKASNHHTIVEVNGRDRLGFLYDVTRTLTDLGLQISSAHISTYGERVVDVFYVKDVFGLKVMQDSKVETIKARLMETIAPSEPAKHTGTEKA